MHAPLLGLRALLDFSSRPTDRRGRFRTYDLRWREGEREPSFVYADADTLRGAIHLLGQDVLDALHACGSALEDVTPPDLAHDFPELAASFAELTPAGRAFALRVCGEVSGPYHAVERPTTAPYVCQLALEQRVGARFVFAFSASPPNQDSAFGVLELEPPGLDDALHRAVARADVEQTRALLRGGTDPNAGAAFGNAPIFATFEGDHLRPLGETLREGPRLEIARLLADAGMDRDVCNPAGHTVLDLAFDGDESAFEWALAAGFHGYRFEGRELPRLLDYLPYGDDAALRVRYRQLLVELRRGADPNEPMPLFGTSDARTSLQWFFSMTYHPHEVPESVLTAFVGALLDHGALDVADAHGQTALATALRAVDRGQGNYRGVVELLRAASEGRAER